MKKLSHWPAMFYKPNNEGEMQQQVFDGPEEVPEGWADSPSKFNDKGELVEEVEIPGLDELDDPADTVDDDDEEDSYLDYNEITVDKLKGYLADAEIPFENGADKKTLYVLYKADHNVAADDITIPEIQAYLDAREVAYDSSDDKATLHTAYAAAFTED